MSDEAAVRDFKERLKAGARGAYAALLTIYFLVGMTFVVSWFYNMVFEF